MRKCFVCVPMITLCFLLAACGGTEDISAESLRNRYQEMAGCSMEAVVLCDQQGMEWEAQLSCEYFPDGESAVEVLSPETIAGVKAVFTDSDWRLEYEGDSLNAGTLTLSLETTKSTVERFTVFNSDFCHLLFPPFAFGKGKLSNILPFVYYTVLDPVCQ